MCGKRLEDARFRLCWVPAFAGMTGPIARHCCQPAYRNGGRHCCQPPLRRAKDLPVFVTWIACAPPSFDPGSPAQASLPVMVQSEDRSSTFHGPSWIDPLFARSRLPREASRCDRKINSSGASCQLVRRYFRSVYVPRDFSISFASPSPAGGDRAFGPWSPLVRLPFPPVA